MRRFGQNRLPLCHIFRQNQRENTTKASQKCPLWWCFTRFSCTIFLELYAKSSLVMHFDWTFCDQNRIELQRSHIIEYSSINLSSSKFLRSPWISNLIKKDFSIYFDCRNKRQRCLGKTINITKTLPYRLRQWYWMADKKNHSKWVNQENFSVLFPSILLHGACNSVKRKSCQKFLSEDNLNSTFSNSGLRRY